MSESQALALAGVSALFFGTALVTAKLGLRTLDARAGAAISIPTATVLVLVAAPFTVDASAFSMTAALLFALVGLFFPDNWLEMQTKLNGYLDPIFLGQSTAAKTLPAAAQDLDGMLAH